MNPSSGTCNFYEYNNNESFVIFNTIVVVLSLTGCSFYLIDFCLTEKLRKMLYLKYIANLMLSDLGFSIINLFLCISYYYRSSFSLSFNSIGCQTMIFLRYFFRVCSLVWICIYSFKLHRIIIFAQGETMNIKILIFWILSGGLYCGGIYFWGLENNYDFPLHQIGYVVPGLIATFFVIFMFVKIYKLLKSQFKETTEFKYLAIYPGILIVCNIPYIAGLIWQTINIFENISSNSTILYYNQITKIIFNSQGFLNALIYYRSHCAQCLNCCFFSQRNKSCSCLS